MTRHQHIPDRLWTLIRADVDGSLTPDEATELEQTLSENDQHARAYLDYLQLCADLALWRRESCSLEHALAAVTKAIEVDSNAEQSQGNVAAMHAAETPLAESAATPARSYSRTRHATFVDRFESAIHWQRHKIRFSVFVLAVTLLIWAGFLRPWESEEPVRLLDRGVAAPAYQMPDRSTDPSWALTACVMSAVSTIVAAELKIR